MQESVNYKGTILTVQFSDPVTSDFEKLPLAVRQERRAVLKLVMDTQAYILVKVLQAHHTILNLRSKLREFNQKVEQAIADALRS